MAHKSSPKLQTQVPNETETTNIGFVMELETLSSEADPSSSRIEEEAEFVSSDEEEGGIRTLHSSMTTGSR